MNLENAHVLVLDPDRGSASITRTALNNIGISASHITTVSTPPQAIEILVTDRRIEVAFVDWHLGGGASALNFVSYVRHGNQLSSIPLPLIVIADEIDEARLKRVRDAGATDVLVRPISVNAIRMRVIKHIKDFRSQLTLPYQNIA